jgi:hypothetical protein
METEISEILDFGFDPAVRMKIRYCLFGVSASSILGLISIVQASELVITNSIVLQSGLMGMNLPVRSTAITITVKHQVEKSTVCFQTCTAVGLR